MFVPCVWLVNQTSVVVYAFTKLLICHVVSMHIAGLMQLLLITIYVLWWVVTEEIITCVKCYIIDVLFDYILGYFYHFHWHFETLVNFLPLPAVVKLLMYIQSVAKEGINPHITSLDL